MGSIPALSTQYQPDETPKESDMADEMVDYTDRANWTDEMNRAFAANMEQMAQQKAINAEINAYFGADHRDHIATHADDWHDLLDKLDENELKTMFGIFESILSEDDPKMQIAQFVGHVDVRLRQRYGWDFIRHGYRPVAPNDISDVDGNGGEG